MFEEDDKNEDKIDSIEDIQKRTEEALVDLAKVELALAQKNSSQTEAPKNEKEVDRKLTVKEIQENLNKKRFQQIHSTSTQEAENAKNIALQKTKMELNSFIEFPSINLQKIKDNQNEEIRYKITLKNPTIYFAVLRILKEKNILTTYNDRNGNEYEILLPPSELEKLIGAIRDEVKTANQLLPPENNHETINEKKSEETLISETNTEKTEDTNSQNNLETAATSSFSSFASDSLSDQNKNNRADNPLEIGTESDQKKYTFEILEKDSENEFFVSKISELDSHFSPSPENQENATIQTQTVTSEILPNISISEPKKDELELLVEEFRSTISSKVLDINDQDKIQPSESKSSPSKNLSLGENKVQNLPSEPVKLRDKMPIPESKPSTQKKASFENDKKQDLSEEHIKLMKEILHRLKIFMDIRLEKRALLHKRENSKENTLHF